MDYRWEFHPTSPADLSTDLLWRNPICGGFPDYWGVFREFDFVSLTGQATVTGGGRCNVRLCSEKIWKNPPWIRCVLVDNSSCFVCLLLSVSCTYWCMLVDDWVLGYLRFGAASDSGGGLDDTDDGAFCYSLCLSNLLTPQRGCLN